MARSSDRRSEGGIIVKAKTPFNEDGVREVLPARLTAQKALEALREKAAAEEDTRYVAEQLGREMGARRYSIRAVSRDGQLSEVRPNTPIEDLAQDVEVRTPQGLKTVRMVSMEVQSYGEVGRGAA